MHSYILIISHVFPMQAACTIFYLNSTVFNIHLYSDKDYNISSLQVSQAIQICDNMGVRNIKPYFSVTSEIYVDHPESQHLYHKKDFFIIKFIFYFCSPPFDNPTVSIINEMLMITACMFLKRKAKLCIRRTFEIRFEIHLNTV